MDKMYRIPILNIQSTLSFIDHTKEFKRLKSFCEKHISKEAGYTFKFDYEIERQWFPVLVTDDKWLAWSVILEFSGE